MGVNNCKKCNRCKKEFPATAEFFQRDRSTPSGFFTYCKDCASIKRRERYLKNRKKWREKSRDYAAYCRSFLETISS